MVLKWQSKANWMSGCANPSWLTSCNSFLLPVQMEPIKEGYLMKQGKFQVSVTSHVTAECDNLHTTMWLPSVRVIHTLNMCICDDPSTSHVTALWVWQSYIHCMRICDDPSTSHVTAFVREMSVLISCHPGQLMMPGISQNASCTVDNSM